MKIATLAKLAITGGVFVCLVGAHPVNPKRDLVTEVVFTTVEANVYIIVDQDGVPYETKTVEQNAASNVAVPEPSFTLLSETVTPTPVQPVPITSATPTPTEVLSSEVISQEAVVTSFAPASSTHVEPSSQTPEPPTPSSPAPSQAPSQIYSQAPPPASSQAPVVSSPAPQPSQQSSSGDRFPIGVTYDPFKVGACKSADEIANEWSQIKKYPIVRIYGMGCDMIPNAVKLAKENNQKIFAGIWTTNGQDSENVDTVVQALASAVQTYNGGNWDIIGLVSVENERVNDKALTASAVADKIRQARAALQTAGYNGPIGAVETVSAMLDHPVVCESSDVALVNVHAFFDNNTKARDAGKFVKGQVERVKKACGGKRVIVTETGWPHQGEANGAAVPSHANQQAAMDSILGQFDHDVFLFNAFDTPWKSDWAGSFSAERYWGMFQ